MAERPPSLPCRQFEGEVVDLALDLIGRRFTVRDGDVSREAMIVETEAYGGPDDPASHASFRPGGRAAALWSRPGTVYVYAAYGMYPCFNIVCGPEGVPSAILLRGVWFDGSPRPILGPGRLTRAMGIVLDDHGASVCSGRFSISAERANLPVASTPRIGITRGTDLPWRFIASTTNPRRAG